MQTLILPGYSSKNRQWLDDCTAKLNVDGIVRPISWDHWGDKLQKFDPKEKAVLISRHTKGEMINIIAKSIGTLVASYVIEAIPSQINKVILNGIPLNDISYEEKDFIKRMFLSLDKNKIICIQNESDSHGSYDELKSFFGESNNILSRPGNDHEYPYFPEFNEFLSF
jgi:hypothetical protein